MYEALYPFLAGGCKCFLYLSMLGGCISGGFETVGWNGTGTSVIKKYYIASFLLFCLLNYLCALFTHLILVSELTTFLLTQCYQLVHEAQLCGLALLDAILSKHRDFRKYSGGVEKILDAARHLLAVQKELGLNYCTDLSSVMLSLFSILTQSELEHEQYSILKLALFLLKWKGEKGTVIFCHLLPVVVFHSMVVV